MADISKIQISDTNYDIKDKVAREQIEGKQDVLVSGTNIKTINGENVLGEGDLKLSTYHPPILSCMWSDHLINDIQWLRGDTFSWQDGNVYKAVYDLLEEEWNNAGEEGVTHDDDIWYRRTPNGFKIAPPEFEQNILNKYNSDGIAWYYILDRTNRRFKLPRTKWGFKGLRDNVGYDIAESLPQHTHNQTRIPHGNRYLTRYNYDGNYPPEASFTYETVETGGANNSTYQDNAPVQERATQMYLYFYVGEYAQTAIEQTAGLNTDLFNNKVDLNASNFSTQGRDLISSLGMPSNRFINFTLGASGTQYIAPVNGYIAVSKTATASGQYLALTNPANSLLNLLIAYGSGNTLSNWLPVKKNDVIQIDYSVAGTTNHFKFIYAEGSN